MAAAATSSTVPKPAAGSAHGGHTEAGRWLGDHAAGEDEDAPLADGIQARLSAQWLLLKRLSSVTCHCVFLCMMSGQCLGNRLRRLMIGLAIASAQMSISDPLFFDVTSGQA
jgi:hypothetical protein